jgi:hypothetical protein
MVPKVDGREIEGSGQQVADMAEYPLADSPSTLS